MKSIISKVYTHSSSKCDYSYLNKDFNPNTNTKIVIKFSDRNQLTNDAKEVNCYSDLIKYVSDLYFHNRNYTLYFRGQDQEYKINNKTTILPRIYREVKSGKELKSKFGKLELLTKNFYFYLKEYNILEEKLLRYYDELKWAIIQHYGMYDTPLLDITTSLQVATSFATIKKTNQFGIIYVLGLPYQSDNITYNTQNELFNIKLNTICTPQALRPLFQEGYVTGHFPISELDNIRRRRYFDFSRRLIAKFKIPNTKNFWDNSVVPLTKKQLLPENDYFNTICMQIKEDISKKFNISFDN